MATFPLSRQNWLYQQRLCHTQNLKHLLSGPLQKVLTSGQMVPKNSPNCRDLKSGIVPSTALHFLGPRQVVGRKSVDMDPFDCCRGQLTESFLVPPTSHMALLLPGAIAVEHNNPHNNSDASWDGWVANPVAGSPQEDKSEVFQVR
jgi:hypothetical protein